MSKLQRIIFYLFAILFFFVPLVLWPFTSEVFEFNKIVLVYALTTLIVAAWLVRSVLVKKFIFHRTVLDIPILIFIGSQFLSTILSIDPLTSLFGYYSRFNGSLLSTICYSLLYWAFVSNLNRKSALRTLHSVLISAVIVSMYGILEHFGIDKTIWVQDVQNRVFSTLGQPNWLAAFLVALMPIAWSCSISNQFPNSKSKNIKSVFWFLVSIVLFITLLFTKSRSGLLGFITADLIFWSYVLSPFANTPGVNPWVSEDVSLRRDFAPDEAWEKIPRPLGWGASLKYKKQFLLQTIAFNSLFIILGLVVGSPITSHQSPVTSQGPALETGGTESGTIRKIVWKGALQVWLHYPIFGSGVETFAYSYYKYRPVKHNLVSEWDFIYNKAHNEFLNIAANSGTIGLLSYLFLIGASFYLFIKKLELSITNYQFTIIALLSGCAGLLVTNFFGFSVVPTQLLFFLFPAIAVALGQKGEMVKEYKLKLDRIQKTGIAIVCTFTLLLFYLICRYWFADTLYAKGKAFNGVQKPDSALKYLIKAISLEPTQALYHSELAGSYTSYTSAYYGQGDVNKTKEFANLAIAESDKAIALSPANINLKRSRFGIFVMLSTTDPNYLIRARDTLIDIINYAPSDAKLHYNLGLVYARMGQGDLAFQTLQKTIDLKTNYKDARLAYALLLIDNKQNAEAKTQLKYILSNIDSNDSFTKQTLESLK